MRNIYDWCISRQLWWGHRIPAWYCADCKEVTVARETPAKCSRCGGAKLEQDNDVLDTWFSSGMLPFTTLGWPEKTRDLEVFYPTSLLLTAFDILFFWVARMIMMGCYFMSPPNRPTDIPGGEANALKESIPFKEVYIHSLVRDAERQKMSKTKGNVVDPIDVLNKFGTDAVRFTLASMAAPGTDIAFSESRTESYRAFANKIWNAARFIFMNVDRATEKGVWSLAEFAQASHAGAGLAGFSAETPEDRWILSRFNKVACEIGEALETYRFHEASHVVYHFFWGEFCDWYIELVKPRLEDADATAARKTFANLLSVFEGALRLLSPFMPFITEEIWHAIYDGQPPLKSISLAEYPKASEAQISDAAETEMAIVQDTIQAVRNIRAEIADIKAQPRIKTPIEVFAGADIQQLIDRNRGALERLANVESVKFVGESLAKSSLARSTARFDVRVIYEQKIDVAAERERLTKELKKLEAEFANNQKQLGNENFLNKAPAHVVEGLRRREGELKVLLEKARAGLDELEGK
jgi:valyl-tRNA synthetase